MSPTPTNKVNQSLDDAIEIAQKLSTLIPVVGGLVSTVIGIFHKNGQPVPTVLSDVLVQYQAEIDLTNKNSAEWRRTHPEFGGAQPSPGE